MNKKMVASLAAAMVLGVAGTSFAASNPFVDVPAKHWSYDAVTKLANAGIVDGYGDGTFRGDKTISRYEMAQIVAKALAHSDKATAEQKASIDKLSVEFAEELEGLNVRVTKLEKNSSTIKVSGEARLKYEDTDKTDSGFNLRSRINLDGAINDEWSYYGRLQAENNLKGEGDTQVTMDNAFVKGPILGTTATIGRFDYFLNNGLMIDSTLNGINVEVGNVVKGNLFYGKDNNDDVFGASDGPHLTVAGIGLDYAASKATSVNGGYYQFENKDDASYFGSDGDKRKIWEAGFKTQLSSNFSLTGSYGKSDASTDDTAYYGEIAYKGAEQSAVGSYGAWVNYRHLEANAAPKTTFDGPYAFDSQADGGKGYEIGLSYTPVLNTVLTVKYADLKATTDGSSSDKTKYYLAQAEFFF
ncbi:UFO1_4202 family uranium-binding S-layer protein [Pelosinus propionicus]|uniref:S-layer homology domain-containing protein n=1 Tax=Pelosinus propionicus DSM 13327 TaxID=1123291 RepID=A0A1I4J506_9FIRM|nr:S-layer homology domain-containing protein [Pelosinus propionicus]SFL61698.1 S-layer homology domain-containing protein [Pelosinus propionicus DSM 13327]